MAQSDRRGVEILRRAIDTFFDTYADTIIMKCMQYQETQWFADQVAGMRGQKAQFLATIDDLSQEELVKLHNTLMEMKESINQIILFSGAGIAIPEYKQQLKQLFRDFLAVFGVDDINLPSLTETHPVSIPLIRALSNWLAQFYPGQLDEY